MSADTKIFTVDKFLGLNESADGSTELKLGEASKIENFYITDNFNLKSRDGVAAVRRIDTGEIVSLTAGNIHGKPWFMTVSISGTTLSATVTYTAADGTSSEKAVTAANISAAHPVKVFPFGDRIYIVARQAASPLPVILTFSSEGGEPALSASGDPYSPTVITGAAPSGGGTALETVNLLSLACRMQYSADGTATAYALPSYVASVTAAYADNAAAAGSYNASTHVFTFTAAPAKGVNNVEFRCTCTADADLISAREKFFNMKHCEAYNGDTDTRLFFYGDGTNVCYYTGIPTYGSGLYVPAGNELAADASASPITAMARNYSSLIGFQTDGAFVVTYEPITLADGSVTAGFFMRTASREFGNEMDAQVQTVNNYLRTLSAGSLYEWRYTSSQYRDERYAKRISEKVSHTLAAADPRKVVTCDDNVSHTYFMFLNDDSGTVLVNRYDLDVWTIYKGAVFRNIRHAAACGGEMLFANPTTVFHFDPNSSYDTPLGSGDPIPVTAVWESGFMAFGADYKRKYSSRLWVSLLPQAESDLEITVRTDKRSDYITKNIGYFLMDFSRLNFSSFSFDTWRALKIKRVQIKVKKFVYYKLILRVTKPGVRATVLGYDQQIRYSSNVK